MKQWLKEELYWTRPWWGHLRNRSAFFNELSSKAVILKSICSEIVIVESYPTAPNLLFQALIALHPSTQRISLHNNLYMKYCTIQDINTSIKKLVEWKIADKTYLTMSQISDLFLSYSTVLWPTYILATWYFYVFP